MSFIPREIYPAVMFARKMMQDGETVGLAVYKAAKYYRVDSSDVAAWLNGKKKKENKPTKYCWYVAFVSSDYDGEWSLHKTGIELCGNRSNYEKQKIREWENLSRRCDTGSVYSRFFVCEVAPKLYKTQKEAELALGQYLHERMSKDEQ